MVFLGIMKMSVQMPHITKIKIESALGWIRRPSHGSPAGAFGIFGLVRRSCPLTGLALQTPFANSRSCVAGLPQHGAERERVGEGFVELVAAHVGVALRQTGQQRSPRRSADCRAAIMLCQLHALARQRVNLRRGKERHTTVMQRSTLVLIKGANVAVTKIIAEDENNVGFAHRLDRKSTRLNSS